MIATLVSSTPACSSSLSVVVPAHNEVSNLELTIGELHRVLSLMRADAEIILVDDGSRDDSTVVCARLLARTPNLRVISHPRNEGYGRAVWDGILHSRNDLIVLMPADLQYRFDELPRLVALAATHDIVVGRRVKRADPLHRRVNAWCWSRLIRTLLPVAVRDVNSGFKVYRRSVLDGLTVKAAGAMMDAEILARTTKRGASIVETDVAHLPRAAGRATGARPDVILRSLVELWSLYPELKR
jgi:glycosyltransferase involved in cell wall biosynthesis